MFNETLSPGIKTFRITDLLGYSLVSRLDRKDNSAWGGIATFAKFGYEECIAHVSDSENAERSWHILHTDRGPIAVAVWYRRPCPGEVDSIRSLEQEMTALRGDTVGTLIVGDLDVHNAAWLRYSSGRRLKADNCTIFAQITGCSSMFVDLRVRGIYWIWFYQTWDLL
jgi:hypothetical protein